jgi:hypothetical protein
MTSPSDPQAPGVIQGSSNTRPRPAAVVPSKMPHMGRRARGDAGAIPAPSPRVLLWFWLGFAWGVAGCCAFTLAAIGRGWVEAWL